MTTAAELSWQTACTDLAQNLATAEHKIRELESCKFRLNGLIVARDNDIARLVAENARLRAKLAAAQAGELDARELRF